MEELESRLYSQVFHGRPEDESDAIEKPAEDVTTSIAGNRQNFRYFDVRAKTLYERPSVHVTADRICPEGQTEKPTVNFNNLTILPSSNTNVNEPHGNITVNQYTIPLIIHTDRFRDPVNFENPICETYDDCHYENWLKELKKLTKKQRTLLKRQRKKERKRLRQQNTKLLQENTKIYFVSDESEEDCVVLTQDSKMKEKQNKILDEVESDVDDIIFIPPPPIEVINVEDEDTQFTKTVVSLEVKPSLVNKEGVESEHYNPKERTDLLHTPESTSNDFLETSNAENSASNFNFSLHGSDFNSNSEFAKPDNPEDDHCETESSCSTNDHSRDYNNSSKSIVFDEVDFPREDIFADKNLDSFGTFITPKRNSLTLKEVAKNTAEKNNTDGVTFSDSDTSTSSTESDYEPAEKRKSKMSSEKILPTLSPMAGSESSSKVTSDDTRYFTLKLKKKNVLTEKNSSRNKKFNKADNFGETVEAK